MTWITANCGKFLKNGNARPPYLSTEKPVCRSNSNSKNWTWNNRLVPNRKRSTSRLYIVTLMAESEEELKSLLMKVEEEIEKAGLTKDEDHGIWSHHFIANRWGNTGNSYKLYFLGLQNHCGW